MSKLPEKTFAEVLADFERQETTRQFADSLKEWLTDLQRTVDDVHGFSLSTENSVDISEFDIDYLLRHMRTTTYEVTVIFNDKSTEKTQIALQGNRADILRDVMKAVNA
jgi:hypothetical protein